MYRKKRLSNLSIVASFAILSSFCTLEANEKIANKDGSLSNIERGWHYQEKTELPKNEDKKDDIPSILKEMLQVQKEQLKVQKNIEKMLQSQLDPQPKKFINSDGKECIENESADCYKYPMLPDAQRTPVLAKFLQDPTVENAIEYKKWEDKHFNHAEDIGYSMKYAMLNKPEKTKTLIDSSSMLSGQYSRHLTSAKADVIKKYSNNMQVFILMSDDGREFMTINNGLNSALKYFKDMNITPKLVFSSESAVKQFENVLRAYDESILVRLKNMSPSFLVSEKTHSTLKPISYPSYVVKYNNKEIAFTQIFASGNVQRESFVGNLFEILVLNKAIERNVINNDTLQKYELKDFANKNKGVSDVQ